MKLLRNYEEFSKEDLTNCPIIKDLTGFWPSSYRHGVMTLLREVKRRGLGQEMMNESYRVGFSWGINQRSEDLFNLLLLKDSEVAYMAYVTLILDNERNPGSKSEDKLEEINRRLDRLEWGVKCLGGF